MDCALPQHALSASQLEAVQLARHGHVSLALLGPPGTGKTTALIARLQALVREGRRPYEMLVLAPQRAQAERIEQSLACLDAPTRGGADIVTYYGLARRALSLFWPLVAEQAGFDPRQEPVFATIEATQYFMWRVVEPLMASDGYFAELKIRRERLLSQLIDNLNKAAVVGFDHSDVFRRLRGAWTGSPEQVNVYWQAQDCAIQFRRYCLAHNLVDFSLTIDTFARYLVPHPVYQRYFAARYRHLLVDNLEENVPVAHDLLTATLSQFESALLTLDQGAGHRVFLGADASSASALAQRCQREVHLSRPYGTSDDLLAFGQRMHRVLGGAGPATPAPSGNPRRAVEHHRGRYWISMIDWVVARIVEQCAQGTPPGQIVVLAPYVSEVMRFTLQDRLARQGVALYTLRPSAPLKDDPVARGLTSLALLAYPRWEINLQGAPHRLAVEDVALALRIALADLDPVRAQRLASAVIGLGEEGLPDLNDISDPAAAAQLWDAVGYDIRERFATLSQWLAAWRGAEAQPLSLFWVRLFSDLLSRPGFGFFNQPERARSLGRLVESARKFVDAVSSEMGDVQALVHEYLELILGGIATAEYLADRPLAGRGDEVLLAPAYAFLTRDLRSRVQFWLDLGSDGWWNRPNQPLTNPYVLSRQWPPGRPWTDLEEEQSKRQALARVILGLVARCESKLYLVSSQLGMDGSEQGGRLERAIVSAWSQGGVNAAD